MEPQGPLNVASSCSIVPASEAVAWPEVSALVERTAQALAAAGWRPDSIVAVHDPASPGGPPAAAGLAAVVLDGPPPQEAEIARICVEGRGGLREVREVPTLPAGVERVLVVDDAAWSGSTLTMARRALRSVTGADVRTAALLAGRSALRDSAVDFHGRVAVARGARFPWGASAPTGELTAHLDAAGAAEGRVVSACQRPWGHWEQLALNQACTVRILTILPDECLSLQYHRQRDELFVALDDGIGLQVGEEQLVMSRGDCFLVPRRTNHRMGALSGAPVRVLEVSFGHYDQVRDIVRLADRYGRVDLDGAV